jgi:hypothetical protein
MANLKELVEHIARRHWEHGQGGQWEVPAGVNPADSPFPAYADEQQKAQYRAYAVQLLSGAPLLTTVVQEDALRDLLSYCEAQSTANERGDLLNEETVGYRDVANRLRKILNKEEQN